MCEPTTIALTVMAVSGEMQATSQWQQGKAQEKMYKYAADVKEQEVIATRRAAERNVTETQGAAAEESKRLARTVAKTEGTARATMGAMGLGGTTAEALIGEGFDNARLDELAIRYNADIASYEIKEDAKNRIWGLEEEQKQYGVAAKNAKKAGGWNAFNTLLSTAASMAMVGAGGFGGGGTPAKAGVGGYGPGTPSGARDMGSWTKIKF